MLGSCSSRSAACRLPTIWCSAQVMRDWSAAARRVRSRWPRSAVRSCGGWVALGRKITQLLSMVQLERTPEGEGAGRPLGSLRQDRKPLAWRRVRGVIERNLEARVQEVFSAFDEQPFAIASLGQVHRARTREGERVAVKVQRPDIGDTIAGDLRNVGLVSPIEDPARSTPVMSGTPSSWVIRHAHHGSR
jgi:predicted unusual protein kinase regulating ubiquinone biosynthesis (AarF/ABC1/UbiB family)